MRCSVRLVVLAALGGVLLAAAPSRATPVPPLRIDDGFHALAIWPSLEYLEDPTAALDFEAARGSGGFVAARGRQSGFGFTGSAYWVRVSIDNVSGRAIAAYLRIDNPLLDEIDLFAPAEGGGVTRLRAGDHLPFAARPFADHAFLFPVTLPPGQSTWHLRFESQSTMVFPMTLLTPQAYQEVVSVEHPLLFGYIGILLVMLLYNALLCVSLRDRGYLYFVAFLASFTLFELSNSGLAFQYLWPGHGSWTDRSLPLGMAGSAIFFTHYTATVLPPPERLRVFGHLFRGLTLLFLLDIPVVLLASYSVAIQISIGLALLALPTLTGYGLVMLRFTPRQAGLFVAGTLAFLLGSMVSILVDLGVMPLVNSTAWSQKVGTVFLVTLCAVLLADRINRVSQALAASNTQLSTEKERLAVTLRSIADGVITADLAGRVVLINRAAEELTGWSQERAAGASLPEVYAVRDRVTGAPITTLVASAIAATGPRPPGEVILTRRVGGDLIVSHSSTAIVDHAGAPVGVVIVFGDITERKRAEEERVTLANQLQQAMKMESIGRLAGGVAHDFNNLLTGISGNVSLAMMDLGPEDPARQTLAEVTKSAERAAALTRQLLAFSRKQIIEPKPIDLNQLIVDAQRMLERLIGEDIELVTVRAPDLGAVHADAGQLEQILVNLVVNARDAMPDGGRITIETANVRIDAGYTTAHSQVAPGDYVRLTVSDTGTGMSEEVKGHLFEPFFTTKPVGRGTGLGLATIYGAIRQNGGHIEVSSELTRGTTFKILLPRVAARPEQLVRGREAATTPTGSETILLVEDERSVREFGVKVLERQGYRVLSAAGSAEALDIVARHGAPIHLLLTDVVMPGMNGRQLFERLHAEHPAMRVLFASGYTDDVIAHHGVLDVGLAFIGKPFSPQELAAKVREVLDGKA